MKETYHMGVYWPPRRESVEQCAQRAESFFQSLARCDSLYERWTVLPRSRKQPLIPIDPEAISLQKILEQSRVRNGEGGIIEDLGFSFLAHNSVRTSKEEQGHLSSLNICCGLYAERLGNVCDLNLPRADPHRERILSVPLLESMMRAMVLAWEPTWGIVTSQIHRLQVTKDRHVGDFVGWLTYLARGGPSLPPLPAPVRIEPVEDKGWIVILTPERFSASNPEHLALAARVMALLRRAGFLPPKP